MDPPVPIPNTVVKHSQADGTWLETTWESRMLPVGERPRLAVVFFFCNKTLTAASWKRVVSYEMALFLFGLS